MKKRHTSALTNSPLALPSFEVGFHGMATLEGQKRCEVLRQSFLVLGVAVWQSKAPGIFGQA